MRIYINSASAISPQNTFLEESYLQPVDGEELEYRKCVEPEYRNYLEPRLLRRMSRIIKMGLASAKQCLELAGIEKPEAIIVGTGLGCLEDTEKFLKSMVASDGPQSPTPFIQSTHNTIAGQISLLLGCHAYSTTFAQRGHSFENALQDGIIQLQDDIDPVLVGGADEITQTSIKILNEMQCWGRSGKNQVQAFGEGAGFFLLSSQQKSTSLAEIGGFETIYSPSDPSEIEEKIIDMIQQNGLKTNEIDSILLGETGTVDPFYDYLKEKTFKDKTTYGFKNLCGEYFTSMAFGLNLGAHMIKYQQGFREPTARPSSTGGKLNNLVIYNHFNNKYHTIFLLKKCQDF